MFTHAIIILGCGIDAAGNLNPDAEGSVRLAMDAYRNIDSCCIIMTGDISYKANFRPSISEAQAMKDYAMTLGLSSQKIFVETESKDTLGNLLFTTQNLLLPLSIQRVHIVRGPNQSTERVGYLAQKVFGRRYKPVIIEPKISRPQEYEREQKSLLLAKKWLDPIEDGDLEAIYHLLRTTHPGYNSGIPISSLKDLL